MRVPLILFFCLHDGMFTLGHGVFIFILFDAWLAPAFGAFGLGTDTGLWWLVPAVAALVISHEPSPTSASTSARESTCAARRRSSGWSPTAA